jgi:Spy/CpxP family protein refolding chaperone
LHSTDVLNKQFLGIGLAVFALALAGGIVIHALSSRRAAPAEQAPLPPPPAVQTDPVAQSLFPPELVMQAQAQIRLSDEQRQAIMVEMQEAQPKFEKLHQQRQQEMAALALLLGKDQVESDQALAQVDKVQALEGEIKRAQLALLIGLKNRLTPEQQAKLQTIRSQQPPGGGPGAGPSPAIQAKMQRLQAGIQLWQKKGRDASPIAQAMQTFEPLIRAGQFEEAEAVLDHALEQLEAPRPR